MPIATPRRSIGHAVDDEQREGRGRGARTRRPSPPRRGPPTSIVCERRRSRPGRPPRRPRRRSRSGPGRSDREASRAARASPTTRGRERREHRGAVADARAGRGAGRRTPPSPRSRRSPGESPSPGRRASCASRRRSNSRSSRGSKRSGIRIATSAPSERRRGRRTPTPSRSCDACRISSPSGGPSGQPAPDREPVEADDPAATLGRGQVDDPGRAGGVDGALAGAEEEPRDDQARDAGGDEAAADPEIAVE